MNNIKELKVGERVAITLEAVEHEDCHGCFFTDVDGYTCNAPYGNNDEEGKFNCEKLKRSDHKNVIFKEVKE